MELEFSDQADHLPPRVFRHTEALSLRTNFTILRHFPRVSNTKPDFHLPGLRYWKCAVQDMQFRALGTAGVTRYQQPELTAVDYSGVICLARLPSILTRLGCVNLACLS